MYYRRQRTHQAADTRPLRTTHYNIVRVRVQCVRGMGMLRVCALALFLTPPRRLLKSQTSGGCKKKSAGQHALDSLTRAHASRARPRPHQRAARWWCDRSSGATCGVRAVVTARAEAAAAWAAHDAAKRATHDRCRWLVRRRRLETRRLDERRRRLR